MFWSVLLVPILLGAPTAPVRHVLTPDAQTPLQQALSALPAPLRTEQIRIRGDEAVFSICSGKSCGAFSLGPPAETCAGTTVAAGCLVSSTKRAPAPALVQALDAPALAAIWKEVAPPPPDRRVSMGNGLAGPPPLPAAQDASGTAAPKHPSTETSFYEDLRELFGPGSDLDGAVLEPDPSSDEWPPLEDPGALSRAGITRSRRDLFSAVWVGTEKRGLNARFLSHTRWLDLLLVPIFLGMLVLVLRDQLRREEKRVTWILLGITAAAALLRLAISPRAPLEAWPYHRFVPAASMIFRGEFLRFVSTLTHRSFFRTDVNFAVTSGLAALTPLVYFGHGRLLFKDVRAALAAAALIAVMPIHLRYSGSDTSFVQSLVASSLCFMLIYTAASTERRFLAWACITTLPFICLATYFARPDAVVFYPLDLAGLYVVSRKYPRWSRLVPLFIGLTATMAVAVALNVMRLYGSNVEGSLGMVFSEQIVTNVWSVVSGLSTNTLVNPATMPPVMPLLMIAGFLVLWRTGERLRALFLAGWLLGFLWIDSYVAAPYPLIARYHMHLLTPEVMLAAAAVPWLWTRPRWFAFAAAMLLLGPLASWTFIRDVDFADVREFAFLERLRPAIPEGCTVLEYREPHSAGTSYVSRLSRIAVRLKDGRFGSPWKVLPLTQDGSDSELSPEARDVLGHPPACLYFYEGLSCVHGAGPNPKVPVCDEALRATSYEEVAAETVRSREYDPGCDGATPMPGNGIVFRPGPEREEVRFVLHHAVPGAKAPIAQPGD